MTGARRSTPDLAPDDCASFDNDALWHLAGVCRGAPARGTRQSAGCGSRPSWGTRRSLSRTDGARGENHRPSAMSICKRRSLYDADANAPHDGARGRASNEERSGSGPTATSGYRKDKTGREERVTRPPRGTRRSLGTCWAASSTDPSTRIEELRPRGRIRESCDAAGGSRTAGRMLAWSASSSSGKGASRRIEVGEKAIGLLRAFDNTGATPTACQIAYSARLPKGDAALAALGRRREELLVGTRWGLDRLRLFMQVDRPSRRGVSIRSARLLVRRGRRPSRLRTSWGRRGVYGRHVRVGPGPSLRVKRFEILLAVERPASASARSGRVAAKHVLRATSSRLERCGRVSRCGLRKVCTSGSLVAVSPRSDLAIALGRATPRAGALRSGRKARVCRRRIAAGLCSSPWSVRTDRRRRVPRGKCCVIRTARLGLV